MKILLDYSHAIFAGHFPEHPVLPGVLLLSILHELLELQYGCKLHVASVIQTKFLQVINPTIQPRVEFIWHADQTENYVNTKASAVVDVSTVFKVSAVFERVS